MTSWRNILVKVWYFLLYQSCDERLSAHSRRIKIWNQNSPLKIVNNRKLKIWLLVFVIVCVCERVKSYMILSELKLIHIDKRQTEQNVRVCDSERIDVRFVQRIGVYRARSAKQSAKTIRMRLGERHERDKRCVLVNWVRQQKMNVISLVE